MKQTGSTICSWNRHRKPLKGGHNSIGASSESRAEMERPKEAVIKAIVSQVLYETNRQYYLQLEQTQLEIRKFRHDMVHHLQALTLLSEEERTDYLKDLLDHPSLKYTVITSPKGVRFKKKRSFQRESERWKLSSKWYLRMEKNRDIHTLLSEEERTDYLKDLLDHPSLKYSTGFCQNQTVNAVINAKMSRIREASIDFHCKLSIDRAKQSVKGQDGQ